MFGKATPQQLHKYLLDNGYNPKPLKKGNFEDIPYAEGGGYKVNWDGDKLLQYHPAERNHHGGDEYFKLSSGKTQKLWFDMDGNPIEE
ncbi:MAG: hypothetical protein GYA50_06195 [Eubacteriaceae bacterium]|nr:hypothetical protein [Eubacteriaceae bacterium]